MTTTLSLTLRHTTMLFALICAMAGVQAGPSQASADAQHRYRTDMALCAKGRTSQPINVCRTEARNALAEERRGGLNDAPVDYARNAVLRCSEFQREERAACESRVRNPTYLDGSVIGGGLLRETVTVSPVK